jgi:hypothetical protein
MGQNSETLSYVQDQNWAPPKIDETCSSTA